MNKIVMPKNVRLIINILEKNGYEAYAVGGCIRDAVLGREPNDWDITTSAMPEDIKNIFHKTVDTGIKHGTVTVIMEKQGYEITTYRIDGKYEDGRHPDSVEFTSNLKEDLKRRDFTINAMAYNDSRGIVDEFDGVGDLERHVIKCVGDPEKRFSEDALRILRAVRFAATLGFDIEEGTKKAIIRLADTLSKISKERIQAEFEKLIMSDNPSKLMIAYETGITGVVFNEINEIAERERLDNVIRLVDMMPKEHYLRWSALLSMSGKKRTAEVLKGFKYDNKTISIVSRIVGALERRLPGSRADMRKDIYEIGEDIYDIYLEFMKVYLPYKYNDGAGVYEYMSREYYDIVDRKECISLKALAVNGRDLIELGAERGEEVGKGLNILLYKVLEDNTVNDRDTLRDMYLEMIKENL